RHEFLKKACLARISVGTDFGTGFSARRKPGNMASTNEQREDAMRKPPKHFNQLAKRYPEYMTALEKLGESAKQAGPIDPKTAELIQLAAAAATRSEGAVHSHTRRAQDLGATRDEIHHTLVLLTSTIGFPTVSAAMTWADDVLD